MTVGEAIRSWVLDKETFEQLRVAHQKAARGRRDDESTENGTSSSSSESTLSSAFLPDISTVVPAPQIAGTPVKMTSDVFSDVDMFTDPSCTAPDAVGSDRGCRDTASRPSEKRNNTVFSAVDRTDTRGGALFLKTLLASPVCDYETLARRREVVDRMSDRAACPAEEQPLALTPSRSTHAHKVVSGEGSRFDGFDGGATDIDDIDDMRAHEKDLMWAYIDAEDGEASALYEIAYFKSWFLRSLNGSPTALTAMNAYKILVSPWIGVLSPILYFVVPYVILRYKAADLRTLAADLDLPLNIPSSFADYLRYLYDSFLASESFMSALPSSMKWAKYASLLLSMLFYFQALFNSFEIARTLRIVSQTLNTRMTRIWRFCARASSVVRAYWHDGLKTAFFPDVDTPNELEPVMATFFPEDETRKDVASGFDGFHVGVGLARYKTFDRPAFLRLVRAYYAVDAVLSICRLLRNNEQHGGDHGSWFSAVKYVSDDGAKYGYNEMATVRGIIPTPVVNLYSLWHPCLDRCKVVRNDVVINRAAGRPNMIITGPNAGGKSTLIKAVVIAALLAQSLTVVPCARSGTCITPFAFINSQINVPDLKGKRSLFEEEMYRAKSNLEQLAHLRRLAQTTSLARSGKYSSSSTSALVVIDEIFSSTNPVEGISGGYAVAKHLALQPNCVMIFSTHYAFLCRLAKEVDSTTGARLYKNYQMPVEERTASAADARQPFVYPYKLRSGACAQYIALELLKVNGFDEAVIDEALGVKRALTASAKRGAVSDVQSRPRT